ncbi:MAG TPA: MMPL family transporter, partial [Mycobacterium sp.]|nr:MMPL family transporter [Mycobacterium sp.]
MLQAIARLAIRAPRQIILVAALVALAAALFGIPVARHLSAGGFQDPTSESAQAGRLLNEKFSQSDQQLLVTVTDPNGATAPAARAVGTDIVGALSASPHVMQVTSPWTSPPAAAGELLSRDGKTGLIVATLDGGENDAQKYAQALTEQVAHDR